MTKSPVLRMEELANELRCVAMRLSEEPFTDAMLAIAYDAYALARRLEDLAKEVPKGKIIQIGRIK